MWHLKQIGFAAIGVVISWILFALVIHYRGKQDWGMAIGKSFLLALQVGISLGFLLFCCLCPDSPVHENFSLSPSTK